MKTVVAAFLAALCLGAIGLQWSNAQAPTACALADELLKAGLIADAQKAYSALAATFLDSLKVGPI
jgi:hypothetical protein